jgi:hypothetical protein
MAKLPIFSLTANKSQILENDKSGIIFTLSSDIAVEAPTRVYIRKSALNTQGSLTSSAAYWRDFEISKGSVTQDYLSILNEAFSVVLLPGQKSAIFTLTPKESSILNAKSLAVGFKIEPQTTYNVGPNSVVNSVINDVAPILRSSAIVPEYSSLPTSDRTIYLNFSGGSNGYTDSNIVGKMPAFDLDGNNGSFNEKERQFIQNVWERVAEDFAPFNVNVTTKAPLSTDLSRTSAGDNRYGLEIMIGREQSWVSNFYPKGYAEGFTGGLIENISPNHVKGFVFDDNLTKDPIFFNDFRIANVISHEVGHILGLEHDGATAAPYKSWGGLHIGIADKSGYSNAWGTIMGTPYSYNDYVTQWDNGEAAGTVNKQDDIATMLASGRITLRADDYGNDIKSAFALQPGFNNLTGIITTRQDQDFFSFKLGSTQTISLKFDGPIGQNLDIEAKLYDVNGRVIQVNNPENSLDANLDVALTAGTYFFSVDGVGRAGYYSDYGSLGQYTVKGTIPGMVAVPVTAPVQTVVVPVPPAAVIATAVAPIPAAVPPPTTGTGTGTVFTSGNDILTGTSNRDVFVLNSLSHAQFGIDKIVNFDRNIDVIDAPGIYSGKTTDWGLIRTYSGPVTEKLIASYADKYLGANTQVRMGFLENKQERWFQIIGDNVSGFQSGRDAVIEFVGGNANVGMPVVI